MRVLKPSASCRQAKEGEVAPEGLAASTNGLGSGDSSGCVALKENYDALLKGAEVFVYTGCMRRTCRQPPSLCASCRRR